MNKLVTFRNLVMASLLCLVAASCSDDGDADTRLPDGKYPMTFTAAVNGLTATRATTGNTWKGTEEVAIQINDKPKKYKAASNGSLTVADGSPFYWQTTDDITVNAWYPYSETKPAANALTVKADQNTDNNYQASDYLEAVDATVTFADKQLAFTHRTAKAVVTLVKGDGVQNLDGAAVTILNQTQVDGGGAAVTPKTTTETTTYTALLVPQQMQSKQFIKVTLGGNTYYYTPTGGNDANLTAGKQHIYIITVKKDKIEVEAVSASWTDIAKDGGATQATFKVHLPDGHGQTLILNNATQEGSTNVYTIDNHGNTFSLSYTTTNDFETLKGFPVSEGLCDVKRTYTVNGSDYTWTFTYTNVRSDLWLEYNLYVEVGDFYCKSSDGSTGYLIPKEVSSFTDEQKSACLGIVYWLGNIKGDNYGLLDTKFPNGMHGLVVSLWDAADPETGSTDGMKWTYGGSEYVKDQLSSAWLDMPNDYDCQSDSKMQGYINTLALQKYNIYVKSQTGDGYGNDGNERVKPIYALANFANDHPAPANSSGWY